MIGQELETRLCQLFFSHDKKREGCSAKNIFLRRRARKFLGPDFASPSADGRPRKIFRIPHVTVPRTVTPLRQQKRRRNGALFCTGGPLGIQVFESKQCKAILTRPYDRCRGTWVATT